MRIMNVAVVPLVLGLFMLVTGILIVRWRSAILAFELRQLRDGNAFVRAFLRFTTTSYRPTDVKTRIQLNVMVSGAGLVAGGCIMIVMSLINPQ
jgi:hypothetical protein